jgi:N-acetylglucosaminyl-diphospho-decaprenol L-rhamnosyltransferase
LSVPLAIVVVVTEDPTAPPGLPREPPRYGAGLAVLVVGATAEPFADAVPAATAAGASTVVLVDGRAPGGVPSVPGATVLHLGEDVGRGAAVNRAVAGLPADIGLVAVAPPGLDWGTALEALQAAAVRHPRAGVLAPRVRDPRGAVRPSTHPLPRLRRGVLTVLTGRPWPADAMADPAVEGPVGWSSAPGLLLRRAALDSVDGFDPRYPGRLDDLDLAQRLGRAGWLTVHVPSATVAYGAAVRPDPAAAHRYLADRTVRPVGALLRATAP